MSVLGGVEFAAPELPDGAAMYLPGRGTTFVRRAEGPPGAPTLLLLHGWTASADLNWFRCYAPLAERYHIVALDHRGHGRGIRSRRAFRLEDCADDAVAVCDVLGLDRVIPVGYSMGGPVAQLMWRRHPQRVAGLVLCATAGHFSTSRQERLNFLGMSGLAALARLTPAQTRQWLTEQLYLQRKTGQWEPWAIHEASRHDWRAILEAGRAIGNFSSLSWIGGVDVPTATILTMRDTIVPVHRQVDLFEAIPGAVEFRVQADHSAVVNEPDEFLPALFQACASVVHRIG